MAYQDFESRLKVSDGSIERAFWRQMIVRTTLLVLMELFVWTKIQFDQRGKSKLKQTLRFLEISADLNCNERSKSGIRSLETASTRTELLIGNFKDVFWMRSFLWQKLSSNNAEN